MEEKVINYLDMVGVAMNKEHYEYGILLLWMHDGDPHIIEHKKKNGRQYIIGEKGIDFYDSFLRYVAESFGWEAWEKLWEAPNGTRSDT